MKINLIAIGKRLSDWVNYVDRLPRNFALNLIEIPELRWTKNADLAKIILQESQILLEAISKEGEIIVLDRTGEEINTLILWQKMADCRDKGRAINLLVGGPEGLAPLCFEKANWVCPLTQLTLPHPLVRIVIAEQIYRAWNIWPIILIIVNDKNTNVWEKYDWPLKIFNLKRDYLKIVVLARFSLFFSLSSLL